MYRLFPVTMIFVLALTLAGCSGDDGPTGPAGADGNANVMYSDWFTPNSYTLTTDVLNMNVLTYDESAASITQEILDTGVVLVFGKLNGYVSTVWPTDEVAQLPVSVQYSLGQLDVWTPKLSVGNLQIHFVNNLNSYVSLSNLHSFRYVIIPGGVAARAASPGGLNLHELSYEDVREMFGVPETGARF